MSKAGKYKVCVGEQFLGHFSGNSPMAAVDKAIEKSEPFYGDRFVYGAEFTVSRGSKEPVTITLGE